MFDFEFLSAKVSHDSEAYRLYLLPEVARATVACSRAND